MTLRRYSWLSERSRPADNLATAEDCRPQCPADDCWPKLSGLRLIAITLDCQNIGYPLTLITRRASNIGRWIRRGRRRMASVRLCRPTARTGPTGRKNRPYGPVKGLSAGICASGGLVCPGGVVPVETPCCSRLIGVVPVYTLHFVIFCLTTTIYGVCCIYEVRFYRDFGCSVGWLHFSH